MTPKLPWNSLRDSLKHIYQQLTAPVAVEFTPPPRTERDDERKASSRPTSSIHGAGRCTRHWVTPGAAGPPSTVFRVAAPRA